MEQPNLDFKLGRAIGLAVKSLSVRNPTKLNSLISDLLAGDLSLRSPLREIVDHQGFLKAEPLTASVSSQALVSVLLDQLGAVYRDETVARVRSVLLGYFGLADFGESNCQDSSKFEEKSSNRDKRTARLDALKSELRYLLQNNQWQDADRKTWQIFVESCGGHVNDTFGTIWPAVPCVLLYEINLLWSNASNFRFGFSIQRGLWESIRKLDRARVSESVPQAAMKKPFEIFVEHLNGYETEEITFTKVGPDFPYSLPAGFYPRCQLEFKTSTSRELEMSANSLIRNFTKVYERLVDCGITAFELDKESTQNLKLKFFSGQTIKQHRNKTKVTTGINDNLKAVENISHEQAGRTDLSPKKNSNISDKKWFEVPFSAPFLLLVLSLGLGLIATPRAREHCSSWGIISRGICYLKEIPLDMLR